MAKPSKLCLFIHGAAADEPAKPTKHSRLKKPKKHSTPLTDEKDTWKPDSVGTTKKSKTAAKSNPNPSNRDSKEDRRPAIHQKIRQITVSYNLLTEKSVKK